jgi:hypothetical protein
LPAADYIFIYIIIHVVIFLVDRRINFLVIYNCTEPEPAASGTGTGTFN